MLSKLSYINRVISDVFPTKKERENGYSDVNQSKFTGPQITNSIVVGRLFVFGNRSKLYIVKRGIYFVHLRGTGILAVATDHR